MNKKAPFNNILPLNNYRDKHQEFINELTGTGYLALRDIPNLISEKFSNVNKVLDFGCGAGRSTRFLKKLGLVVDGIDINKTMLQTAQKIDPLGNYFLIYDFLDLSRLKKYDLIFNLFVLFEFGNKDLLISYLTNLRNILTLGGGMISIVNSEFLFTKNWLSCNNNFEQNKDLKKGDIAKLKLPLMNDVEVYDYYWEEADYINFFKEAGFQSIEIYKPLGNSLDPYEWLDEYYYPPYSIYLCR